MTLTVSRQIITWKNVEEERNDVEGKKELLAEIGTGKMWILNGGNGGTFYLGTYKHHKLYSNGFHENYWYFNKSYNSYLYYGSYAEMIAEIDKETT